MPILMDALRGRDLGFLRMVAGAWGIELSAPDAATALPQVASGILTHPWREDVLAALPREARAALQALLSSDGRMGWALFSRRFGEVRSFGPGKRDRERPDLKPSSPAEVLWYRALIGRAFLNEPGDPEPLEYAYIPEDLIEHLQSLSEASDSPPGRRTTPAECAHPLPANDRVLDHAATLLAALRTQLPREALAERRWPVPPALLRELLKAAALVDDEDLPHAEAARAFLEAPRGEALAALVAAWRESPAVNELRLLPGLKCEGDWRNDPLRARKAVLDWLQRVPASGAWWSLASFVKAIHERDPDFQRPAGDYDSWFIRRSDSEEYLRGFDCWDEVDGALVRFLVCGPLHWLGILDLAAPDPEAEPAAFRFSSWAEALLRGATPHGLPEENGRIKLTSAGRVLVPRLAPRAVRYQVARFCLWEDENADEYRYRIVPQSLERAAAQGLRPRMLLSLLRKHADTGVVPPALAQAIERWETAGTQATIEAAIILRLSSPAALEALKKSRAARFILEEVSPSVVLLRPGVEAQVMNALQEGGFLTDVKISEG